MAKQTKLQGLIEHLTATGVKVVGSEPATSLTDAMVDLGNGVAVQMTRRGLMFLVVTHADGKMSFDMVGTYTYATILAKVLAAQSAK